MKTKHDFESAIEELLDEALNTLSPDVFGKLLDDIGLLVEGYEE